MTERNWIDELESWLQALFIQSCEAIGQRVPLSGLRISPAFGTEESKYFLLGLEAGLFQPDEEGCIQSDLLSPLPEENTKQKTYQIFWHNPPPSGLFRGRVCQLATASSLILERGWPRSQVLIEPRFTENHSVAYGADILVRSSTGEILVGVEVKRGAAELEKLITDMRACCKRGLHAKDDCGFPQNHPNYEFCAFHKPSYFWGVAPDADVCFRMTYDHDSIQLEQLATLPARSMIE